MPFSGGAALTVYFADATSDSPTKWLWNFGDGGTSTLQNPTHTYSSPGVYTVLLTVTTSKGTLQVYDTVTVLAPGSPTSSYTVPAEFAGDSGVENPKVMLRISNDGGNTWISEQIRPAGKLGEYWRRVRWTRLGAARRRVFEVSVTDPVSWKIVGAYLTLNGEAP
jgi:PKD repeat protein